MKYSSHYFMGDRDMAAGGHGRGLLPWRWLGSVGAPQLISLSLRLDMSSRSLRKN